MYIDNHCHVYRRYKTLYIDNHCHVYQTIYTYIYVDNHCDEYRTLYIYIHITCMQIIIVMNIEPYTYTYM